MCAQFREDMAEILLDYDVIQDRVKELAAQISKDYEG